MWDFLQHLSFWDWLALGTVLLILEVFGAGGYLLWMGIAAGSRGRDQVSGAAARGWSGNCCCSLCCRY